MPEMLRRHRWVWLLLSIMTLGVVGCTNVEEQKPKTKTGIVLESCHLTSSSTLRMLPAQCGSFVVPEDWSKPQGRKIKLHLAVVPAKKKLYADPLFFFTGGPGQAATESYPIMAGGFSRINKHRDVVLIDQRGTGRSSPIRCDASVFKDQTVEPTKPQLIAWLKKCIAKQKKGLQHYTTTASIRDFNAVRKALGYKKINLYGISYGTRVAQSYMRRYSQHVRSVILDGVVPQDMSLGWDATVNAPARVKKWIILRCYADKSCRKAFPKLGDTIASLEQIIKTKQPIVEMRHPLTHKPFKVRLSWSSWSLGFRLFGYSSAMVTVLPLLLHQSHKTKDLRPLFKWVMAQLEALKDISKLENSVMCAEDFPFIDPKKIAMKNTPTGYGQKRIQMSVFLCKTWPNKRVHTDFKKPVKSNIPTLLLSGQYDPVTPPMFAKRVAKYLKNHLNIVVPGEGHGVIGHGCIPKLTTKFVRLGSVKTLKPECIKKHKPTGFFIDFSGPEMLR